ncbi:Hypothetical predicted protein [Olea europaea subsp. europaea]|uniref:BRX domain-containing protein n=1 Tax=Olea europaea subsp. europaea TaxID=158383 RepID=A0A8S0V4X6_OLEEU|nr:Hypothetical predicted protein [Olea europaea subsp. europaea]
MNLLIPLLINKPSKPRRLRSRIWHRRLRMHTATARRHARVSQFRHSNWEPEYRGESDSAASDRFRLSYRRTGSSNSSSTAGRRELEGRLKGVSSGEGTPGSASGRQVDSIVFVEDNEPKEWVAQVEPGVLITFVSLPRGRMTLSDSIPVLFSNFAHFLHQPKC